MSNTPNAPVKPPGTVPRQGRNPPRSLNAQLYVAAVNHSQLAYENAIQEGLLQPYHENTSGLHTQASGYETPDEGNAEEDTPVFQAQNQGFHTPPRLSLDEAYEGQASQEPPPQEPLYWEACRNRRYQHNQEDRGSGSPFRKLF